MPVDQHSTACVAKSALLEDGVKVGAFAFIGEKVQIGAGTEIGHHATVDGNTRIGQNNKVFPYAFLGGRTQDLKYRGGDPGLVIGHGNTFREFSTVHCATGDGDFTRIGSHGNFLSYSHVAHDCTVGDHVILSNNATFAGHVTMGDYAIISGLSAIHQFCRIGCHAFIGGCSKVVQDIPPYMIADGHPAEIRGVNKVGLQRHGFTAGEILEIRRIFKILYRSGLNRSQAMGRLRSEQNLTSGLADGLLKFLETSERGMA